MPPRTLQAQSVLAGTNCCAVTPDSFFSRIHAATLGPSSNSKTGRTTPSSSARSGRVREYPQNRYRREIERHYWVLDRFLAGRDYFVGADFTIMDMSAWAGSTGLWAKCAVNGCQ